MRTAIIITGEMRTFATCVYTQRWHVYRHYPNADFYISTVSDTNTETWRELPKILPNAQVSIDIVGTQPTLPEPAEPVRFEPYVRSVPLQAILRQLWQLQRGWELVKGSGREYDQYIRMRPDSFFHSFRPRGEFGPDVARTPWWGRFGGVQDRFAVLGHEAAPHYFKTLSNLQQLIDAGCPLQTESMVYGSMVLNGVRLYDNLLAEFSTLKDAGTNREPEISPVDFVHALR